MKEKGAVYLPHTAGRYAAKRFRKSQVSVVIVVVKVYSSSQNKVYVPFLFYGMKCPVLFFTGSSILT